MTVAEAAFAAWTAHNLPDGMEPGPGGRARLRSAELQLAVRRARRVVEIDTETGAVDLVRYVAVDDLGTWSTR